MRLIIAGSRHLSPAPKFVNQCVRSCEREFKQVVTSVITGGAEGVDAAGAAWARDYRVPVRVYHADWKRYGPAAGPIRNRKMASIADALLLIWDGRSRGSASMLDFARKFGLRVYEVRDE